jgi:hypothetical protein
MSKTYTDLVAELAQAAVRFTLAERAHSRAEIDLAAARASHNRAYTSVASVAIYRAIERREGYRLEVALRDYKDLARRVTKALEQAHGENNLEW